MHPTSPVNPANPPILPVLPLASQLVTKGAGGRGRSPWIILNRVLLFQKNNAYLCC